MLTNNSQRCQADFMWVADRFFEAQGTDWVLVICKKEQPRRNSFQHV